jgi:hypothetical protein
MSSNAMPARVRTDPPTPACKACHIVFAFAVVVATSAVDAAAKPRGTFHSGSDFGARRVYAAPHGAAAGLAGMGAAKVGGLARGGDAGTLGIGGIGSHGSGWHSGGFGGTLNPGWGYGFSPSLGGSGH